MTGSETAGWYTVPVLTVDSRDARSLTGLWPGDESERGLAVQTEPGKVSTETIRGSVLFVTDDSQAGHIWAHALSHREVDVVLVGSAEGAWQRWKENGSGFDMVIIDVYTHQLDGIALCRRLHSESDEPILLLTPGKDEAHLLEAYEAGVDECIVKPVSPLLLVAKVLAWLRNVRAMPAGILPGEGA